MKSDKKDLQDGLKVDALRSLPFTFRLAALLALAAWKDTSPVISNLQL